MLTQNPNFELSQTAIAAEAEAGHTTSDTSNGVEDKQDGTDVIAPHAGDGEEPVYETGWRLWAVMLTICITTLLAALDIVSIWSSTYTLPWASIF